MSKLLVVVLLFVGFISVKAQDQKAFPLPNGERPSMIFPSQLCGLDMLMTQHRKDPLFKTAEAAMNAEILRVSATLEDTTYLLPVVFHIITQNPATITDQNVADAVKNLNDIFGKTGAYAASAGADTRIRFCLARKDPDGGNSTGITRTSSAVGANHELLIEDDKLKNLNQWDPSRYINIWIISSMATENMASFSCGIWTRLPQSGYAYLPLPAAKLDGIVYAGISGGTTLAHEMGHYLGLYHTFEGLSCANNSCEADGDRVCDTPPDAFTGNAASCNNPTNSCSTDTLSNHSNGAFSSDVPDQIANIMDYGNDACHNQFTEGQAKRMRAAIVSQRSQLLQNECDKPCPESSVANFSRNNWNPIPGDLIQFTNTASGASKFLWYIDDVQVSTTVNFSHSFNTTGKYKVTLRAYNNDPSCYAAYTDYVIVTCGTRARFYTDKRSIASSSPVYTDSIRFNNNSINATSYQWLLQLNEEPEQVVSTSRDYKHVFLKPGSYTVRMIANNGGCSDTTEKFPVPVADPTPDGILYLNTGQCYEQSKIRVTMQVCNYGYAPIPAKIPISFYDADPRAGSARKVGNSFLFPDTIKGNCCSLSYPFVIDSAPGLNQLYAVLNDSGTTIPLKLPNTNMSETNYLNNISFINNLQVNVTVIPATATLLPGDTLRLGALVFNGFNAPSYTWSSASGLNCTSCTNPFYVAEKRIYTENKRLIVTNSFGCTDTSYAVIKIPPYDDFTITLDSATCAGKDSMHVSFSLCNSYAKGNIPAGMKLSFYDADPLLPGAKLLAPVFNNPADNTSCTNYETFIKLTTTGKIFAVVNSNGLAAPIRLPGDSLLVEKDYTNNISSLNYQPETISLSPADTTVFKKQTLPVSIVSSIYNASSISWLPASGYSLSCSSCLSPLVTVKDSSDLQVQMANRYGCIIKGSTTLHVFPPDLELKLLETSCYTNNTTLVKFLLCMNNSYDSVSAGIPVSFYDGDPNSGNARLLGPLFYTKATRAGNCDTLMHVINSAGSLKIYAVANDRGTNSQVVPDKAVPETDYTNNTTDTTTVPFRAQASPADTTVLRLNPVLLTGSATGGRLASGLWKPADFLSCTTCATPVARPGYSTRYQFIARNEHFCTDTAFADIKTFAGGLVSVPNAFTPDNDSRNDVLYVMGNDDVLMVNSFSVYDRWGQKVFSSLTAPANDPRFGWNGLANGRAAAVGTYVYVADIQFKNGSSKLFKGTVILIR